MRFLVDEQLPAALARWLSHRGHTAEHVDDVGLSGCSDQEIWERAAVTTAVLVSKDEDFVSMRVNRTEGPALVWVRIGNVRTTRLIARFEHSFDRVLAALREGERLVELR